MPLSGSLNVVPSFRYNYAGLFILPARPSHAALTFRRGGKKSTVKKFLRSKGQGEKKMKINDGGRASFLVGKLLRCKQIQGLARVAQLANALDTLLHVYNPKS